MDQAQQILSVPKTLGTLADGSVITLEIGRFGPYLKAGTTNSSIDPTIDPFTITPEQSVLLVEQGREQKRLAAIPIATFTDPATQKTILVKTGRFGPYVTDGEINASVSKKFDPATLTLEQALDLLEKKRIRGPGRFGKKAVEKAEVKEKETKKKARKKKEAA
jgi:DNA topoisomerase-1